MINSLITSQTRIKLLKKFFLNSCTRAHLRGLETEFGESTNSIRVELNRLEGAGLLTSVRNRNKKYYQANPKHPLFVDIHNIILKEAGIDRVIEKVIHKMGKLFSVYLTGDFAKGRDSDIIELIIVGDELDRDYLERKIIQARNLVGRDVRYMLLSTKEAEESLKNLDSAELLLLWDNCLIE
jgi:hypothetical protein